MFSVVACFAMILPLVGGGSSLLAAPSRRRQVARMVCLGERALALANGQRAAMLAGAVTLSPARSASEIGRGGVLLRAVQHTRKTVA